MSDGRRGMAMGPRGARVDGPITAEVLVIGGGLSGAAAALAARREGRNVALVRRAWGSTALGSGLLELAPDPLATPYVQLGERRDLLGCIRALATRAPEHPWALLRDRLGELPALLRAATEESGGRLSFGSLDEENGCFLTSMGTLKTSAGWQDGMAQGDLLAGGTIGVVGFANHPGWNAKLLAAALDELGAAAGLQLRAIPLACDYLNRADDFELRAHQLASRIEADPDRLVESIRRILPAGITRLLLPPLLGRSDPRGLIVHFEAALGIPCAEFAPATIAPLPGLRLQRMLEARLEEAGVALWLGEAFSQDGALGSLQVRQATPPLLDPCLFDEGCVASAAIERPSFPVRARSIVLATGRYIGGGIGGAGRLRETVFDLPVRVGGAIDAGGWIGSSTQGAFAAPQAAFTAGVAVDPMLRPLDRTGRPRDAALFACGSVIAGNDPARDGAGQGLSWCTGWLAGRAAAMHGGG